MEIHVKESIIIRPSQETPKRRLRMSDLDLTMPSCLIADVFFFRQPPKDSSCNNFFEADLLKESLSKVLVPFYPLAGRMSKDENGRTEMNCNGEGVLFAEAETSCVIDDFGDFESSSKLMKLVPHIDETKDSSFYLIFMTQVTRFQCGGVCVGILMHHTMMDGTTAFHFMNSWSEVTRGVPISNPPVFDRSILDVGVPNSPSFHHIEYDPPPSMNTPIKIPEAISTAILKLSLEQLNTLKEKSKKDHESFVRFSRFEVLAAHIWRCASKARGLSVDQASKLDIPTSGRFKLNPKVPFGYAGNVVFSTTPITLSSDLQSESLNHTTERIHKALKRVDDKYLKSALAYLKQQPDLTVLRRDANHCNCPNLVISKLADMPMYNVDFGWGVPVFTRPVAASLDGDVSILPSPNKDGSWLVDITLETNHLKIFRKLFYDIFL